MNFSKVFRYVTDRPFLMALIVFVVLFIGYNYLFKNKSSAASTIAQTAIPTSGRPVIYNQEFVQYPVTPNAYAVPSTPGTTAVGGVPVFFKGPPTPKPQ